MPARISTPRPRSQTGWRPVGPATRSLSALDGTGQQAANEVALESEEHDQRQDHGYEGGRRQQLVALAEGIDEVGHRDRQGRNVGAAAKVDQGDQEVVPDEEELENRQRSQHRN